MADPYVVWNFGQPDQRPVQDRAADAERAAQQLARAEARWSARQSRLEYLWRLRDRRNRNETRQGEQIEVIELDDREFLVMRYEVLTTGDAVRDPDFLALLGELGWEQAAPREHEECLGDHVARLTWTGDRGAGIQQELDRLRGATPYPVAYSHVVPFGAVIKGGETPEATSQPAPVRPKRRDCHDVPVAVIDTGIAFQQRGDDWLMDLLGEGEEDLLDVIPHPRDGFLDAGAGHGTFVAGVVQQVAPHARIKVYQTLDTDGLASETRVACAMVRAVREMLRHGGRLVVNLSLGTDSLDDEPLLSMEAALDLIDDLQAKRRGEVMLVAAAGNSGDTHPHWPAAFDRVVAVGALDQDLRPADFSTRGPWVDCSTVGVGVRSTYVQGDEAPELTDPEPPDQWGADSWGQWLGTSFAAPQVAGAVAALADEFGTSLRLALLTLLMGRPRLKGLGRTVRIL
jgi:subtilisin family serine protease